jgi:hypothetical protein
MAGREDYILRHIALLRQFLAQMLKLRRAGQPEQAMMVLMQAQEKLFGRAPAEISVLSLAEQLQLLAADVSPEEARERQKGYALLLKEAGLCLTDRDRRDLAESAFKTALHIVLTLVVREETADVESMDLARDLLARIPPEQMDAPMKELLAVVAAQI